MKLGGLGTPRCGFDWHRRAKPPTSTELAEATRFVMPHGDAWAQWRRHGTGEGYYCLFDALSPHTLPYHRPSSSRPSYDAPIAHFGLGEFAQVERVEVLWSTGERSDMHGDFVAGSRYIITRQKHMQGVTGDNVHIKRPELPPPANFQ